MSADDDNYSDEEKQRIAQMAEIWFDMMNETERSTAVTVAEPKDPEAQHVMLTKRGSPNDRFWKQMVALGWAAPNDEVTEGFQDRETLVAFALNPRGQELLPKFLNVVT